MFRKILVFTIFTLVLCSCVPATIIPTLDFTATPEPPTVIPTATVALTETSSPSEAPTTSLGSFTLTSSAFENNGAIPAKYTCGGADISPALAWNDPPVGTVSFTLIVDDPDAVKVVGYVWDHWILFNLPAEIRVLDENVRGPEGSLQGVGSGGQSNYQGPCPPSQHHYDFTLYALDTKLELKAGATKKDVLTAIEGHILAQSKLVGLYPAK
jgi:Raf kinase inhibitor-like YbhB/YbcL family protein